MDARIENWWGVAQHCPWRALQFALGSELQRFGLKNPSQYEAGGGLIAMKIEIVLGASSLGINMGIRIFIPPDNRAEPQ